MTGTQFLINHPINDDMLLLEVIKTKGGSKEIHLICFNDECSDGYIMIEPVFCYISKETEFDNFWDYVAEHKLYVNEEGSGDIFKIYEYMSKDVDDYLIIEKYHTWERLLDLDEGTYLVGFAPGWLQMPKIRKRKIA